MDYAPDGHNVHLVVYHIIWCPKRRRKVLVGPARNRLEQIIREVEVAEEHRWEVIGVAIQPEHVHLFIRANPTPCPPTLRAESRAVARISCAKRSRLYSKAAVLADPQRLALDCRHRQPGDHPALHRKAIHDVSECQTTVPVRLYPTPEQAAILRAHCREYLSTVNVLVHALDSDVLPEGGKDASTKDFTAVLPSAVKNQALRDARSIWKRAVELGILPVLRKPICQWNNQNWRIDGESLIIAVCHDGQVGQVAIRCSVVEPLGKPGILRITRKRDKWVADVAYTLPEPEPTSDQGIMGVDLGVKVPAVVHVINTGTRFFGNGRQQRAKRRQFYARRKAMQAAKQVRAVRKSQGKERRWRRDTNHKLSHAIVAHAQAPGVGIIRREQLARIRQRIDRRTARTSRGAEARTAAKARKNNRMIAAWTFHQLARFIAYKAERAGIKVEWVDPAYTSQTCPACFHRNKATDRRYVCAECGWTGHRDAVGAITNSRRTGRYGNSAGAAVASGSDGGRAA